MNMKGLEVFNYADKPDLNTCDLVRVIGEAIGKDVNSGRRIPYTLEEGLKKTIEYEFLKSK